MQNFKVLTIGILCLMLMAYFGDVSFGQVLGNSVSQGMTLGRHAGRGSSMMGRFNRYSTGSESVTTPVPRAARDLLSVRTTVNMRTPMSGLGGVSGPRAGSRPVKSNLLQPTRPAELNQLIFSKPNMLTLGNLPRDRFYKDKIEHKVGSLQRIISNPGQFTIKPQHLLRPDIQQQKSPGSGLLRSSLSIAQRKAITHQTALTRNLLTSQDLQLSRKPTIFDIGRQVQNERHAPQSIFNIR